MIPVSFVWTFAGGIVLVLLGLWVVRLSPRTPVNRAVSVFAVSIGVRPIVGDLGDLLDVPARAALVNVPILLASAGALVWLALRFPDRESRVVRNAAIAGGLLALASFVASYGRVEGLMGATSGLAWEEGVAFRASAHAYNLHLLAFLVPLVALPVRAILAREAQTARRAAALASALVLYPATLAFVGFLHLAGTLPADRTYYPASETMLAATPILAILWLVAAQRGPDSAAGRNVALLTLAVPLFFVLNSRFGPDLPSTDIARVATVVALVVAITRGQLLGADTAIRWTISKSTIAAVFIAVFFIASETAQQFFGETLGSTYVGIGAAGALVFAIAPLQRVAERLAERAVPVTSAAGPAEKIAAGNESIYRDALRLALRDRTLTREEEAQLHRLAEALRIRPGRAHEMLADVEREAGGG